MKAYTEASRLFEDLHFEHTRNKIVRRKISETMKRIVTWFNKELRSTEILPSEFNDFIQNNQTHYEENRMKYLWSKAL